MTFEDRRDRFLEYFLAGKRCRWLGRDGSEQKQERQSHGTKTRHKKPALPRKEKGCPTGTLARITRRPQ